MNTTKQINQIEIEQVTNSSSTGEQIMRAIELAGQVANQHAARNSFADYTSRKAQNTVGAQHADLVMFSTYLRAAGIPDAPSGDRLQSEPNSWIGITWGIVDGFARWQLQQGHAISSVNRRLSTIKTYTQLAAKAGVVSTQELALIKTVKGYGKTEAKRINASREKTRIGDKKAKPVKITQEQAKQLKRQPDIPQGRRDALLMCLLLDHGLRVGEVAILQVSNFDLKSGTFTFERPKVDGEQTHRLTADTLRALYAWISSGDCPINGLLLRESITGGSLTEAGINERAIKARVRLLGERIGITGLSPHDCRHYWATYWANKVDILRLQEAGGWASLEMPRRYVERAEIANEGMA